MKTLGLFVGAAAMALNFGCTPAEVADGQSGPSFHHLSNSKLRVLVIGDSVSRGYTPFVHQELSEQAEIIRNYENAYWSAYTLENLDTFLGQAPNPDIITWNNGLHDLSTKDLGKRKADRSEYQENLRAIAQRLLATGAKVIFFTTTHVPRNEPHRSPHDVKLYNLAARQVMEDFNIPVYDLGALSETMTDLHTNSNLEDNVHWTSEGSRILGKFVADAIREVANFPSISSIASGAISNSI